MTYLLKLSGTLKVAYHRSPALWNKKGRTLFIADWHCSCVNMKPYRQNNVLNLLLYIFYTPVISLVKLLFVCVLLFFFLLLSHILKFRRKFIQWHLSYKLQNCLAFMFIFFTYLDVWPANSNLLKWKRNKKITFQTRKHVLSCCVLYIMQ